jgi:calcium-dependent protein kinase
MIQAASLLKDIRKEYRFKNQLGGGHFGTVRKAYRISEKNNIVKFYAIKSIPMKNLSCNIDDFIKEVDIISTLDHPNIIKFYETYHDDCFFHIVMELCKGKEIVNQMGNYGFIEEKKVTNIIFKVLLAIVHCHNRGVTHRDLKPENILFDSMKKDAEIKLIDFGLSRKYDKEQKMHSILGTPYYVAPEVLKGEYDEKCDIWSIGAMTYLMLCGEPPFNGNSNNEIFKKIVKENIKFKSYMWKNISNSAKDFVKICLNKNSTKRPSASEALNHPWFSNVIKDTHNVKKIKKEILLNIKNFNISYQFKLMVLKYLVDNKLSHEEKQIFKASFYALDFNHNGFIIEQDLIKAFKLFNIDIDEERIEHLFNILPDNKNLGLGFSEFIMAGIDKKLILTEKNLEDAFNYFDINKTGDIEFDNLNSALLRNGKRYVNSNDINTIIDEVMKDVKKNKGNDVGDIDNNKEEDDCPKISKEDFMEIFKEF